MPLRGQRSLTRRSICQAASTDSQSGERSRGQLTSRLAAGGAVAKPDSDWEKKNLSGLHCNVPGDRMSSSMSSRSSDRSRFCGVGGRRPRKDGSRFRAAARAPRPGLLTTQNPVRDSICCQRWSFSRRAAVTSARACLSKPNRNDTRRKVC